MKNEEKKSWLHSVLGAYLREVLSSLVYSAKRKLRRYAALFIIVIASLSIIFYGIGSLLGSFFPEWRPGVSHIIIGIIIMLIARAYSKFKNL